MTQPVEPERVYGVDFSGSADAGENIWIAEGVVEDDGLHVVDCQSACDRFGVVADRADALAALTAFLSDLSSDTVVGLDFPFGLPRELVTISDWQGFLSHFPDWFTTPEELRRRCTMHAELVTDGESKQLLRRTEEPLGALSAYDVRLQNQTFYGVRDVLRPLVTTGTATVQPMQTPSPNVTSVIEVYPAGTLEELQLNRVKYKDNTDEARKRREENLDGLAEHGLKLEPAVREPAIENSGGDALDSVVAAFAVHRNTTDEGLRTEYLEEREVEGHIYV
jgi:hypothetical protein